MKKRKYGIVGIGIMGCVGMLIVLCVIAGIATALSPQTGTSTADISTPVPTLTPAPTPTPKPTPLPSSHLQLGMGYHRDASGALVLEVPQQAFRYNDTIAGVANFPFTTHAAIYKVSIADPDMSTPGWKQYYYHQYAGYGQETNQLGFQVNNLWIYLPKKGIYRITVFADTEVMGYADFEYLGA